MHIEQEYSVACALDPCLVRIHKRFSLVSQIGQWARCLVLTLRIRPFPFPEGIRHNSLPTAVAAGVLMAAGTTLMDVFSDQAKMKATSK